MDGTFLGEDAAMDRHWDARETAGIVLAISTALPRSFESFYAEHRAERRAACVCMVGTEGWLWRDGRRERGDGWGRFISHGWDKPAVEAIFGAIPEARMQDREWRSEFKSSCYLEERVKERLALGAERLDRRVAVDTLHVVLKHQPDIEKAVADLGEPGEG